MGTHAIQRTLGVLAVGLALVTALGVTAGSATADSTHPAHKIQKTQTSVKDLGPSTGLLPSDHLTLESAIQVDLDKETARLPLYKGTANGGDRVGSFSRTRRTPVWRTTWASTSRPSSPTSRSAARSVCRR